MAAQSSTTARGYGTQHQKLRKRVALTVKAGTAVCWRCGLPIHPWQAWDLGHSDDRTRWVGPEHSFCNRSAAGRKPAATQITPANNAAKTWARCPWFSNSAVDDRLSIVLSAFVCGAALNPAIPTIAWVVGRIARVRATMPREFNDFGGASQRHRVGLNGCINSGPKAAQCV